MLEQESATNSILNVLKFASNIINGVIRLLLYYFATVQTFLFWSGCFCSDDDRSIRNRCTVYAESVIWMVLKTCLLEITLVEKICFSGETDISFDIPFSCIPCALQQTEPNWRIFVFACFSNFNCFLILKAVFICHLFKKA